MNVLLGYFSIRPITIQFKFRCTSNNHPPSIQTARHYTRRDAEQAPTQLEFHRLSPLAHFVSFPLPPASEYKGEYFGMHFNLLLILTPCLSFSPLSIHPSTSPADLYMFILALLPVSVNDNEGSDSFSQLCRFASGCIVLYPLFMSSTTIRTGFVLSSPPLSH